MRRERSLDHGYVYHLRNGRVGRRSISEFSPANIHADFQSIIALPKPVHPSYAEILPVMADITARLAPFAAVYCVPSLCHLEQSDIGHAEWLRDDSGRIWGEVGGVAYPAHAVTFVSLGRHPSRLVSSIFHEIFHIFSPHLSAAAHAVLDAAVATGAWWPTDYQSSAEERKARLFEHWATGFYEGQPPRPLPPGLSVDSIFEEIASGRAGAEVMANRAAAAA